jgi:N-acetyl-anhydromuramoyl-L-alanine amidase
MLPSTDGSNPTAEDHMHLTDDHWLMGAERCPSPNHDDRPDGTEPSLLVIHSISLPAGDFGNGNVEALFCNRLDCSSHPVFGDLEGLRVSAHLLVARDGRVVQFVPFDRRAWHAGRSSYRGRAHCNDFSIGIELEGTDTLPFEEAQYRSLAAITRTLMARYRMISPSRIVGHVEVAPDRKTDPGPLFDWRRYLLSLLDAG